MIYLSVKIQREISDKIRAGQDPNELAKEYGIKPQRVRTIWATGGGIDTQTANEYTRMVKAKRRGWVGKRLDALWLMASGRTPFDVAKDLQVPTSVTAKWYRQHEEELEEYRLDARRRGKLKELANRLETKAILTKEQLLDYASDLISSQVDTIHKIQGLLENKELLTELVKNKGISEFIRTTGDESFRVLAAIHQIVQGAEDSETRALPPVVGEPHTEDVECGEQPLPSDIGPD